MKHWKYIIGLFIVFISCENAVKRNASEIVAEKVNILPFFNSGEFTPEWIDMNHKKYNNIHKIPDFTFTNQDGKTITQKDYLGKIYVADFFFTSCTGICRSLSLNMKTLQDEFINDTEVLFISHSVTPDLDSVPVLKKYAIAYGIDSKKWNLVRGDKKSIYELARTAYFSDEDFVKTSKPSEFIHTENFLLIDKKGRIRGVYNGTLKLEAKRLMRHIEILKKEV